MTDTIAKLAVRARDIYDNFSDAVGGDCGFFKYGILNLSDSMEISRKGCRSGEKERFRRPRDHTRRGEGLLSGSQPGGRRRCAPLWRDRECGRLPDDAVVRGRRAGVRRGDSRIHPRSRISTPRAGASNGWKPPGGAIVPGKVVLACGPWSHKVARSAGLRLPIQPSQVGVSFYRQPPDFYDRPPVFSVELAIIPWHNKHFRVLCDRRDPLVKIEPDPTNAVPPQWMVDWTTEVIQKRLPKMKRGRFQGAYQTCYDDTPDLKPLLGYIAGYNNLFLDCGWSGRGFKFSVALGEYNAKWIMEGKTELDLAPWLASRFLGA